MKITGKSKMITDLEENVLLWFSKAQCRKALNNWFVPRIVKNRQLQI